MGTRDGAKGHLSGLEGQEPELQYLLERIQQMIGGNSAAGPSNARLVERERQLEQRENQVRQREDQVRAREEQVANREQALAQNEVVVPMPGHASTRAWCPHCLERLCTRNSPCFWPNGADRHNHNCDECHQRWCMYGTKGKPAYKGGKGHA